MFGGRRAGTVMASEGSAATARFLVGRSLASSQPLPMSVGPENEERSMTLI